MTTPGGRRWAALLLIAVCLFGGARLAAGAVIPIKAVAAQWLLERAFERSLATGRPQRPWPWADMAPIGRLSVPRLGLKRIVLDSGSGQAMAFAPSVLPGGARLGERGVSVIAAHRDTHFAFLGDLRRGDLIAVETGRGHSLTYRVTGAEVVRWNSFAVADGGGSELALATCYPFGAIAHGPLRYVVDAIRS